MNFSNWETWHYVIAACGALLVVAIILYFIPGGRLKISGMASCGLVSLVVGVGLGIMTMTGFGYHWDREPTKSDQAGSAGGPGRMGGMGGGRGGGGPPPGVADGEGGSKKGGTDKKGNSSEGKGESDKKGAAKKGGGGGMMAGMQAMGQASMGNFRPTPPKDRLVSLVIKLDLLTSPTPLIKLTDDQKAKIREQLNGLDKDEIKDEEALKKLEDILEIVEGERKSLEMAGFQYPGAGGDIPRPSPNPFKVKNNADHVKALQERLAGKSGS